MKGICFSCTAPRCVKGRKPNLQRSAWPDYQGDSLNVSRSIWKTFINRPKTRASAQAVPVRILRHAKPHVTRERYIKAFDPVVLAGDEANGSGFGSKQALTNCLPSELNSCGKL
jgi:hypothetical protein